MGLVPGNRNAVAAAFRSAYLLASWTEPSAGRHRVTARYDVFRVRDRDDFVAEDPNDESGTAWTLAYAFIPAARHRITAEVVRANSTRSNRRDLGLDPRSVETLGTLSWRISF